MSNKTVKTAQAEAASAVVPETKHEQAVPEKIVPKEMTTIEKVKLMSDLASACQDPDLIAKIQSLSNGDRIFNIFVSAVEKELSFIMGGIKQDTQALVNVSNMANQLTSVLSQFRDMVAGFMQTPLVHVLDLMNKNLGGRGFQYAQQQMNPQQVQVPATQPIAPSQDLSQQETISSSGARTRGSIISGY